MTFPTIADVKKIAVVGAGTIGASWTAWFLARGFDVSVSDPDAGRKDFIRDYVLSAWDTMKRLHDLSGQTAEDALKRFRFAGDIQDAVDGADFVQESAPERIELKRSLFAAIDAVLASDRVIASSTSGFTVSEMNTQMRNPGRLLVGHPFNPPHLMPLVEIVGSPQTHPDAMDWAMAFYRHHGKRAIRLNKEVPGHIANRLQAAVWREAVHLVDQGVASVADVDAAMTFGPGLRWAFLGPHLTFHLGGGPGGMAHFVDHIGPAMQGWWDSLGSPRLSEEIKRKLVSGLADELGNLPLDQVMKARDTVLGRLIQVIAESEFGAMDRRSQNTAQPPTP